MPDHETVHYTVKELFEKIDHRLEQVDKKLDDRLDDIERRLQSLELTRAETQPLAPTVQSIDERLDKVEDKIVRAAGAVAVLVGGGSFLLNYFMGT